MRVVTGHSLCHGAAQLPAIIVDAYNADLRDAEGLVGDRASRRAFSALIDDWRERLRKSGQDDPLGDITAKELRKRKQDEVLLKGTPEAAALIHSAVEDFAQELTRVIRRLLQLKEWRGTQTILVGGGFRASRLGELAIGRADLLLKTDSSIVLTPIHHHPDEAGLLGCVRLAPSWIFSGHGSILAVDIGGSNIRVGLVELNGKKAGNFAAARVRVCNLWRHADDQPSRDKAVERLAEMLRVLIERAKKDGSQLAPFIGIGCPGLIREDGSIERGGQNLPGNWEARSFNLPHRIRDLIPSVGGHDTEIVMHNDAVMQGLSEVPFMRKVPNWAILTIGTGLGNAHFRRRETSKKGRHGA
jgi:ROK family